MKEGEELVPQSTSCFVCGHDLGLARLGYVVLSDLPGEKERGKKAVVWADIGSCLGAWRRMKNEGKMEEEIWKQRLISLGSPESRC